MDKSNTKKVFRFLTWFLLHLLAYYILVWILLYSLPRFGLSLFYSDASGKDFVYQSTDWVDGVRYDNYGYPDETVIHLILSYVPLKDKYELYPIDEEVIIVDRNLVTIDGKVYDRLNHDKFPDKYDDLNIDLYFLSESEDSAYRKWSIILGLVTFGFNIVKRIYKKMRGRDKAFLLLGVVTILYYVLRILGFSLPFLPIFLFYSL